MCEVQETPEGKYVLKKCEAHREYYDDQSVCDCPPASRGKHVPGGSECWGPSL